VPPSSGGSGACLGRTDAERASNCQGFAIESQPSARKEKHALLFALPKSRRKTANLNRDPRAAVTIFDPANPYESVQVQGTAALEDDPDGKLIDELSYKYTGGPYPGFAGPSPEWVIARITADKVLTG
jgi:PPOX class probable F420-dependent enzyme